MASDSDCSSFMTKALYFEESGEELDLNLPPTTGEEYLRRVQLEARQCPSVVVASNVDWKPLIKKQTVMFREGNGCSPAPSGYAASRAWNNMQLKRFAEVRQNLAKYKRKLKLKKVSRESSSVILPDINDDVGWCKFCFGSKMQPNSSCTENGNKAKDDVPDCVGTRPLLSVVTQMSQPLIEEVFEYHINWFDATGFTVEQGEWFYALLACLEKPLTPGTCSSIRSLARLCANLRAAMEREDPLLPHMNLFICLVGMHFNQQDLIDPREDE